jgi:hypothetical protein
VRKQGTSNKAACSDQQDRARYLVHRAPDVVRLIEVLG